MTKEEAEKEVERDSKDKILTHIETRTKYSVYHEVIQNDINDPNSFEVKTTMLNLKTGEPFKSNNLIDRFMGELILCIYIF